MLEPDRHDEDGLTEAMHERIKAELAEGERLVWAGRPVRRLMGAGRARAALLLCGVLPLAGGTGLIVWAIEAGKPDHRLAFGSMLAGVGLLLTPLLAWGIRVKRRVWQLTLYALTDRRAITWTPDPLGHLTVRSFYPTELGGLHRKERPDGAGNVILTETTLPGYQGMATVQTKGFLNIDRVREVEQLVRDTLLVSAPG